MSRHQHILAWLNDVASDLHAIRHDIHAHPELGFEESRTSALVAQLLLMALAMWAPLSWWTLYTGFISYGLIGLLFAGEWLIRQQVRKYE